MEQSYISYYLGGYNNWSFHNTLEDGTINSVHYFGGWNNWKLPGALEDGTFGHLPVFGSINYL